MTRKVIVVAGGNESMSETLCEKILESYPETFVYLCGNNASRGHEAVASMMQNCDVQAADRIEFLEMDVTDEGSVMVAAMKIGSKHAPGSLYAIVNNTDVGQGRSIESAVKSDYFGPKNVTLAFLPLLNPVGGRVVNISSSLGRTFVGKLPYSEKGLFTGSGVTSHMLERRMQEAIEDEKRNVRGDSIITMYPSGFSAACLNVLTRDFAEMHPALLINSCSPGIINDNLSEEYGPDKGTRSPLHLLFSANIGSGLHFKNEDVCSPLSEQQTPGGSDYEGHFSFLP